MKQPAEIPDREYVFGTVFTLSNKLQLLLDREFAPYGITAKQWFTTIVLSSLFGEPPTLKDVAKAMEMSHQNVKQIALKLQQIGFLEIRGDEADGRAIRLSLTEKCRKFGESLQQQGDQFLGAMFDGIEKEELRQVLATLNRNRREARSAWISVTTPPESLY